MSMKMLMVADDDDADASAQMLRGWSHAMSHGHNVGDCAATR